MLRILVIIFISFFFKEGRAQYSPLLSQYMFNPVALNPSFTGSENAMSIIGSFRAQWLGVPGAPTTESLTFHAPLKKYNSSIGFNLYGDQIGVDKNTGFFGNYAYKLKLKRSFISFGVSAGVNMIQGAYSKLDVASKEDIVIANDSRLNVLPNISLGANLSTDKYFISFSIPMMLTHRYNGDKFKLRNDFSNYNYLLGGGYDFIFENKISFMPSILLKYRVNNRLQADFNIRTRLNEYFDLGLSYRTEEAIVIMTEIKPNKQFSFMYSFGLPINSLIRYTFGSHEISLKYNLLFKSQAASPRYLSW